MFVPIYAMNQQLVFTAFKVCFMACTKGIMHSLHAAIGPKSASVPVAHPKGELRLNACWLQCCCRVWTSVVPSPSMRLEPTLAWQRATSFPGASARYWVMCSGGGTILVLIYAGRPTRQAVAGRMAPVQGSDAGSTLACKHVHLHAAGSRSSTLPSTPRTQAATTRTSSAWCAAVQCCSSCILLT
jgi:hypothetical protein